MSALGLTPTPCALPQKVASTERSADTCALIVAGGAGERFGDVRGKQYVELCGLPIVCWSLIAFDRAPSVAQVVLVVAEGRLQDVGSQILPRVRLSTPVVVATGGSSRQDSVFSGLTAMDETLTFVAVHDAARPLIETPAIEACIARLRTDEELDGAICAARSTDTLKLVEGQTVIATPDRSFYWAAQTPQVFRTRTLKAAHRAARFDDYVGTDDASLVERRGGRIACVETSTTNLKVTHPNDFLIAQAFMEARLMSEGCGINPMEGGL